MEQKINIHVLNPHPRHDEFFKDFIGDSWKEFLESITLSGIVEPIVITPNMTIVSGHQRVRAAKELGIETIMVDIQEYDEEEDVFLNMLLSNLNRVKEIPSLIKRCEIISEIERIFKKREQKIKKQRDIVVNNYRKNITKNKEKIINYYNGQCEICKFNLIPLLEIHHILPLQQGGDNSLDNITCLCPNCHTIIHKFISHFCNGSDINNITQWLEENYSKSSFDKLIFMYEKYIKKKEKYGWEELTWI